MTASYRTRIALDFAIGTAPVGRLVIELYEGKTPKTCEQFAGLAIASASGASETWEPFDQIIPGILIRSGRVVGQTELGESPFEARFEEENLGWRKFDERGLVGIWGEEKDSARRPFFITLGPCPILNNKHTVFGRVVSDDTILDKIASVPIDPSNHPTSAIEVINCEIVPANNPDTNETFIAGKAEERGRLKRRRMSSHSPTRAKSPSRGHDRESGSRYRHHYRKHRKSSSSPSISPPSVKKNRRRSDAELDHTLRGRPRKRSRSRTRSPLLEGDEALIPENHRKRSQPPSRHRSESAIGSVEGVRRQRSFPNIYREERVRK